MPILKEEFAMLGEEYKRLEDPSLFPVHLSSGLKKLQEQVIHEVREKELGES